jgi:hypothetical protein
MMILYTNDRAVLLVAKEKRKGRNFKNESRIISEMKSRTYLKNPALSLYLLTLSIDDSPPFYKADRDGITR